MMPDTTATTIHLMENFSAKVNTLNSGDFVAPQQTRALAPPPARRRSLVAKYLPLPG